MCLAGIVMPGRTAATTLFSLVYAALAGSQAPRWGEAGSIAQPEQPRSIAIEQLIQHLASEAQRQKIVNQLANRGCKPEP